MDRPAKAHIEWLSARLEALTNMQMSAKSSRAERNTIEAEIRGIELALAHYKSARKLPGRKQGKTENPL
jgi:hypothetical protein